MSIDEKYNVISDLLAKAKEEGLDSARLHAEIRKGIQAGNKTFGTFLDLVESLQDIIPKEKQRYNAAIKALSKTSGLSRQNIIESTDSRLEELKKVEEAAFSALTGFSDELNAMATRSKTIRSELTELRKQIAALEKEEQEILGSIAGREKERKAVEQAVKNVFTDVEAEIAEIKEKIVQYAADVVSARPIPPPAASEIYASAPAEEGVETVESAPAEEGVETVESAAAEEGIETMESAPAEESVKTLEAPAPQETKWLKKCPLCGGQMNFHINESLWMCYTCGNEELETGAAAGAGNVNNASKAPSPPEPEPAMEPSAVASPAPAAYYGTVPELTSAAEFVPPSKPTPGAFETSGKRPSPRKKPCPVCRKQMNMDEKTNTWKCPSCNYQRREL